MDIELKGNTDGRIYKVDFSTNAMCRIEESFGGGKSCGEILDDLVRPTMRISEVRKLVQAMLSEPKMADLDEVGRIIDDIGGPAVFVIALRSSQQLRHLPTLAPDEARTEAPSAEPPATSVN